MKEKIKQIILGASKIVILRHQWPDFDALGSQYGLAKIIEAQSTANQQVFIGGGKPVNLKDFGWSNHNLTRANFEDALLIVVDTADSKRIDMGEVDFKPADIFKLAKQVIKIDHHPQLKDDGYPIDTLRLVDTSVSSCSELLAELFDVNGRDFDQELLKYLYTGIIGDTGRLSYGFSSQTLAVLAELLANQELQPFADINHSFGVTSLEEARMKGYYYDNLVVKDDTAWLIIDQKTLSKYAWPANQMAIFVNILGTIRGVAKWVLCIQYEDSSWRLRVRSQNIDISGLAREYGGGGHPFASGINLPASTQIPQLEEFIGKLITIKK